MTITVSNLCNLYIEGGEMMRIWCAFDTEEGNDGIVFEGTFNEAMRSDFASCEVETFGIEDDMLVINIA